MTGTTLSTLVLGVPAVPSPLVSSSLHCLHRKRQILPSVSWSLLFTLSTVSLLHTSRVMVFTLLSPSWALITSCIAGAVESALMAVDIERPASTLALRPALCLYNFRSMVRGSNTRTAKSCKVGADYTIWRAKTCMSVLAMHGHLCMPRGALLLYILASQ